MLDFSSPDDILREFCCDIDAGSSPWDLQATYDAAQKYLAAPEAERLRKQYAAIRDRLVDLAVARIQDETAGDITVERLGEAILSGVAGECGVDAEFWPDVQTRLAAWFKNLKSDTGVAR